MIRPNMWNVASSPPEGIDMEEFETQRREFEEFQSRLLEKIRNGEELDDRENMVYQMALEATKDWARDV